MYGNLNQLRGDLTARSTWERLQIASAGGEGSIDEARLQELLFRHADFLPLGEIDPAYQDAVPICMELGTRAGSADALYLTAVLDTPRSHDILAVRGPDPPR